MQTKSKRRARRNLRKTKKKSIRRKKRRRIRKETGTRTRKGYTSRKMQTDIRANTRIETGNVKKKE